MLFWELYINGEKCILIYHLLDTAHPFLVRLHQKGGGKNRIGLYQNEHIWLTSKRKYIEAHLDFGLPIIPVHWLK